MPFSQSIGKTSTIGGLALTPASAGGWLCWRGLVRNGIGQALVAASSLSAGWSHLPGRKGMVNGFIVCGAGFGSFLFGIITHKLCNPDNVEVILVDYNDGHTPE